MMTHADLLVLPQTDRFWVGKRHLNSRMYRPVLLHEPLSEEQRDQIARAKARFCPCALCGAAGPSIPVQVDAESWEGRCEAHAGR